VRFLPAADLFFDGGLLVLIWLVQLIIYPSFKTQNKETFVQWHANYSSRISLVVIPLMFGQVICAALLLLNHISALSIINIVLILLAWISTFLRAVPLHRKFASGSYSDHHFDQLVQRNWSRTILWSAIFLLNFVADGHSSSIQFLGEQL